MMPYGKVPIPARDDSIPVNEFNVMKQDLEKHLTKARKSLNVPRPRKIRVFEDSNDEEIELPRESIEDTSHIVNEAPLPIVSLQDTYKQRDTEQVVMSIFTNATSKSKTSMGRKGKRQKCHSKCEVRSQYDSSDSSVQRDLSHKYHLRSKGKTIVSCALTEYRKRLCGRQHEDEEGPSLEAHSTLKQRSQSVAEPIMKVRRVTRRIESSSDESQCGKVPSLDAKDFFRYHGKSYRVPTTVPFRRGRSSDVDVNSITCAEPGKPKENDVFEAL
uniref:Uncharacterized protein n=1 Tax=Amphimedon queenslandica TaxID=400682 RepID=A0A1X7UVQ3_AMPQE